MRLLITRPAEDAAPLAKLLEGRGHEAVLEPLLDIAPIADAALDLAGVQALLFTSANGVRAFAGICQERSLPVFAVGDRTAEAARDLGFAPVDSAGGDVADLAGLVKRRLDPARGALLHPAASQLAGDLAGLLKQSGFDVRRQTIYEARPAKALTPSVIEDFQANRLDGVLFFSPRTAQAFATLAQAANIGESLSSVTAYALSGAVAQRLEALPFKTVRIARQPEQDALLALIDEDDMTSDAQTTEPTVPDVKPVEETPAPIRSTKRAVVAFLLGGVLGIALVAGAGGVLWPVLVEALKREMAVSEPQPAPAGDVAENLKTLESALARRIAALEARPIETSPAVSGASAEEVAKLAEQIARLDAQIKQLSSKRETGQALLISVLMLREANIQGRPFAQELETLAKLEAKDEDVTAHLAALKPMGEKGVVTQGDLQKRFQAVKPALLRSTLDESEGLWQSVLRRLSVLISIRRTDAVGQEASGIEGAVARAEADLEKSDLAGAVANLSTLAGPAGDVIRPWLGEAYAHIEAETHIQALLDRALALAVKS